MGRARRLQPGSIIDVIAPASAFDAAGFQQGLGVLRDRGFRVRCRDDIAARDRFLAGSDARRLEEVQAALSAEDSDAIWCVRGGYGCTRLLPDLSIAQIRTARKLLIGFSDVTALHDRWRVAGVPSLHGTMVARLAKAPAQVNERLFALLATEARATPLEGRSFVPGTVEGPTAGGNLALLAALCGTPYQPDLTGAIVLIEDVGERVFRLDRMMVQCTQAGLFRGIAGIAIGELFECGEPDAPALDVLIEHARRLGVPTVADLPFGHGPVNHAVPLGVRARLDATVGRVDFLEPLT